MSGNKTIEDMFQLRDKEYAEHMEQIKEYLKPTLEGLEELFNPNEERQEGTFAWEIFELTQEAELLIVGTVKYQPGDVLVFGSQPIEVTEQNAPLLERIFRFIVPIALADKQSSVETVKHMETVIAENETDAAQAQQIQSGARAIVQSETGTPEFDTDELTDEQKEALFLSTGVKT